MQYKNDKGGEFSYDLYLSFDHWLQWSEYKGAVCGGRIWHNKGDSPTGICCGAFWTSDAYNVENGTNHAIWQMTGTLDIPTLAPSFRCHCGDHGHIVEGKWIPA